MKINLPLPFVIFTDTIIWMNSFMSDGKILATAAGQLKTFNCSDHKKIQKFSGHPVSIDFHLF